ncbi:MAG: DUF1616 domain-containing protein [Candidatus Bathyarchaeota archaeon]|nr:DUF1616 domain-containing protein [Candidatus Bathyarchaeota archaeon]
MLKDRGLKAYNWLGIIVAYTVLTVLCVYIIPNNSPFSVFTYVFGFVFVAVVPGYCLLNVLFQEGKLDLVEKAVLSVALSFSIVGISGLFLGLSPIGITVPSIIVSLTSIVLVLAFVAFLKKRNLQSVKQANN